MAPIHIKHTLRKHTASQTLELETQLMKLLIARTDSEAVEFYDDCTLKTKYSPSLTAQILSLGRFCNRVSGTQHDIFCIFELLL